MKLWVTVLGRLIEFMWAIFGNSYGKKLEKLEVDAKRATEAIKKSEITDAEAVAAHNKLCEHAAKVEEAIQLLPDNSKRRKELEDSLENSNQTLADLNARLRNERGL